MFFSRSVSMVFSIVFLVILLFGWFIQFSVHVILGEDPVISNIKEFIPFFLYSIVLTVLTIWYIKLYKEKIVLLFILLISDLFWIRLWIVGINAVTRNQLFLLLTRYLGLLTSLIVLFYILWVIIRRIRLKNSHR